MDWGHLHSYPRRRLISQVLQKTANMQKWQMPNTGLPNCTRLQGTRIDMHMWGSLQIIGQDPILYRLGPEDLCLHEERVLFALESRASNKSEGDLTSGWRQPPISAGSFLSRPGGYPPLPLFRTHPFGASRFTLGFLPIKTSRRN